MDGFCLLQCTYSGVYSVCIQHCVQNVLVGVTFLFWLLLARFWKRDYNFTNFQNTSIPESAASCYNCAIWTTLCTLFCTSFYTHCIHFYTLSSTPLEFRHFMELAFAVYCVPSICICFFTCSRMSWYCGVVFLVPTPSQFKI